MNTGVRSARNELFQKLKPRCIELSQLALKDDGSLKSTKALVDATCQVLNVLEQKCKRNDGAFDEKLADYVFFPLSQILKKKKKYTDRLSELVIKCLRILLEYGWNKVIALDLARQFLILLAFVAGGPPDQEQAIPEEIAAEAYGALAALFHDIGATPGGATALVKTDTIPALGHCVTVILEGITDGASVNVQLQALKALDGVWQCIKDVQALATFLPGTISSLTKTLMPGTNSRRSRKTLISTIGVLEHVLTSILSDVRTRNIRKEDQSSKSLFKDSTDQKVFTKSWLKATTAQIKLALANIVRLRKSTEADVRKTLNSFCLTILDECHDTLSESAQLLVETCITLDGVDSEDHFQDRRTNLTDLATIYPDLGELVKNTTYNWATSLPRVMQANDESTKQNALENLQKANSLLKNLNAESSVLKDTLISSLRDSVTVTLESLPSPIVLQVEFDMNSQAGSTLVADDASSAQFRPIILAEESQRKTRESLTGLLTSLGTRESQLNVASKLLEYVRSASGPSLLAAYWLSFQTLKASAAQNEDIDAFFDSALTLSNEQEVMNEELISYSQSVLANSNDEEYDWRMQATALEVVADRAQRLKEDFRPELIDTLYPVAQLLGSPDGKLREHAITCLNIVSKACGYKNASDLIVDNVDYMVNAISLKLNTFDISPQTPQVLVMMIRLAGPSLLLYLDDVVGSIFAALDNFHGYQHLVEALFLVLHEIVKVGSKSSQLQITAEQVNDSSKTEKPAVTIEGIITLLSKTTKTYSDDLPPEDFPKEPWKSAKTLLDEANPPITTESEGEEEAPPPPQELAKAPQTKTYILLQSITRLSQHYLTSFSPILRTKLLTLISTSAPPLSHDQESFLPLVNDIWPVLITRIYDPETYVSITAMSTISTLCKSAGDFLASRIAVEWLSLLNLSQKIKVEMKTSSSNRGIYADSNKKWEAVIDLLCSIVEFVGVQDEMFDDVLEILGEVQTNTAMGRSSTLERVDGKINILFERESVRKRLSGQKGNADAVWLACYCAGRVGKIETPILEGYEFVSMRL